MIRAFGRTGLTTRTEMAVHRAREDGLDHSPAHLHVLGMDDVGHELADYDEHYHRTRLPALAAALPARVVPQVQLHPRCVSSDFCACIEAGLTGL